MLTGPTAFEVTGTVQNTNYELFFADELPQNYTISQIVDLGTQILSVRNNGAITKVTITGPTTWVTTLSGRVGQVGVFAGSDTAEPHCTQSQH